MQHMAVMATNDRLLISVTGWLRRKGRHKLIGDEGCKQMGWHVIQWGAGGDIWISEKAWRAGGALMSLLDRTSVRIYFSFERRYILT